jgi:hypothetical protein
MVVNLAWPLTFRYKPASHFGVSRLFSRPTLTVLFLAAAIAGGSGCKWAKQKLGMGWDVEQPERESPEWVIQRVLEAASKESFDEAWADYSQYLHSEESNSPAAMQVWETMKFKALRNKHQCFLRPSEVDDFAYELKEIRELSERHVKFYVSCKTSDMPTPCELAQDPEAGNKWRVRYNCLN